MGRKGSIALGAVLVVALLAMASPAGAVSTAVSDFTVSHMAGQLRVAFLVTALPEVSDGPDVTGVVACARERVVKVQRMTASGWETIRSGKTGEAGWYSDRVADRVGSYRAVAPSIRTAAGARCDRAVSSVRTHRHN